MAKQVFYSFHYKPDVWRVSQIRNIGTIEGNRPASDNKWEEVKGNDSAIEKWIDENMKYRSCTIVLVGSDTAKRKWIDYEIKKTWRDKKGLVGIHIHNLKDSNQRKSDRGANPFSHLALGGKNFDEIVKCYNPPYTDSQDVYNWISRHIAEIIDEAIGIRNQYR